LIATVSEIHDCIRRPMSADATHATQTLLWKGIDVASASGNVEAAMALCRLAQHALFDTAGDNNKSKLARKMISIALSQNDLDAAREAFFQMPESGKDAVLTRYLMYRVGLRSHDEELTTASLDRIIQSADKDATYLYACVIQAQQSGDRKHTIDVLRKVLARFNYATPPGIYLPALLRTTAQMMMHEMVGGHVDREASLTELCKIFEAAVSQEKHFHMPGDGRTHPATYQLEINWFAKSSYNLGLQHCEDVSPVLIMRLLQSSVELVKLLRKCSEAIHQAKLDKREQSCQFLIVSASVVLARSEDNIQASMQHYLTARKYINTYLAIDAPDTVDIRAKRSQLLRFDIEAILKLERWDDLDTAFSRCLQLSDIEHLETLADLILIVHAHMLKTGVHRSYHEKVPLVMQKIINQSWRGERNNTPKLARWLRCVFRMTLTTNTDISLQILDQVVGLCNNNKYPQDELEWLASTAFNQAVDCHCASDTGGAQIWGEKALNLAKCAGPALYQQMQGLWTRMMGLCSV